MRLAKILLAGAMLVATTSAADATITIYTTLSAFTAATTAQGTDTFNNLTAGAQLPLSLTRTAGAYSYTVKSANGTPGSSSLYGAGSTADAWLSNNLNADSIIFNGFTAGVRGAGGNFFGSDFNGLFVASPLGITVTATDASGTVTQTLLSSTTTSFLGFVSTTGLTSLSVAATVGNSSYWPTINNLTLAQGAAVAAVPESATWAMMLVGFGMMGASIRYRRRSTKTSFA
ncbi:MAG: PEPxxWA-CTERM sorting domain-containing protein [Pseudomonadota bacterium]|nr:PEPxxWA-CTERM sorting domain-containing protein [Pseudomonadota bacterium]